MGLQLPDEAGLGLESVGNYYGTDGLTVGDLPEMKVYHDDEGSQSDGALVMFSRIPTIVIVRQARALMAPVSAHHTTTIQLVFL